MNTNMLKMLGKKIDFNLFVSFLENKCSSTPANPRKLIELPSEFSQFAIQSTFNLFSSFFVMG